jgi:hypothetical protein
LVEKKNTPNNAEVFTMFVSHSKSLINSALECYKSEDDEAFKNWIEKEIKEREELKRYLIEN